MEVLLSGSTVPTTTTTSSTQCTGANPRYPLIKDLRAMLRAAWESPMLPLTTLETDVHD